MLTYTSVPLRLRWIVCKLGIHYLGFGTNAIPTAIYRRLGAPLCECACLRCGKWIWVVNDGCNVGPVSEHTEAAARDR